LINARGGAVHCHAQALAENGKYDRWFYKISLQCKTAHGNYSQNVGENTRRYNEASVTSLEIITQRHSLPGELKRDWVRQRLENKIIVVYCEDSQTCIIVHPLFSGK